MINISVHVSLWAWVFISLWNIPQSTNSVSYCSSRVHCILCGNRQCMNLSASYGEAFYGAAIFLLAFLINVVIYHFNFNLHLPNCFGIKHFHVVTCHMYILFCEISHFFFLGGGSIPHSIWDLSSLIRDWTHTPAVKHGGLTTRPPGKSLCSFLLVIFQLDFLNFMF